MSARLREDQRRQLGDHYVHVVTSGGPPLSAAEQDRLHAWGTAWLEGQLPLLERLVFEAHLLPPCLEIHAGRTLPGKAQAFEVIAEAGRPTFRIAADAAEAGQAAADALLAYLQQGVSHDVLAASAAERQLTPDDYIDRPHELPPFGDGFDQRAGRRGTYSMADGPDRSKGRKNTWGDLTFYRRLRDSSNPAERQEWEFWRDYLFQEETRARFSPQDWLRALRVLNGLSTAQMGSYLGMQQAAYCNYENRQRYTLSLQHCQTCLKHNLFHLPARGHDPKTVEPDYARLFLAKFGHDPRFRDQLAAAIKARALTEFTDPGPSPWPMQARPVLHALTGRKKVRHGDLDTGAKARDVLRLEEWQADPARTPASDYLFVAPVEKSDKVLAREPTELHRTLAQRSILSLAGQAQHIGDFLGRYHQRLGLTTQAIGHRLGVSGQRVRQYHRKRHLSPRTLDRMIDSNAYDFPTGEDGHVHPEVSAALNALNYGRPYRHLFASVGEAAKALSILPMELVPQDDVDAGSPGHAWVTRALTQYQVTPAREAWSDYWAELEQRYKLDGRLLVAGEPLRCWLDEWDRLLIHQDDIPRLAHDPQWLHLRREASGRLP
jgi:transcriptional regulator with XRE-family HTH domain